MTTNLPSPIAIADIKFHAHKFIGVKPDISIPTYMPSSKMSPHFREYHFRRVFDTFPVNEERNILESSYKECSTCVDSQLKKYGESITSCKSKLPLSGRDGNVNSGYSFWKLSSNCMMIIISCWIHIYMIYTSFRLKLINTSLS